jgi:hypothetical protein
MVGRCACLLAAVTVIGSISGCGGESDRDRVESYLKDANGIQRQVAPQFKRTNDVYRRFITGKLPPAQAGTRLGGAERTIRVTRARLAKLAPPPPAARLHRRLLDVYDLNAGLAHETTELGRYLPAATAALKPIAKVNRRLGSDLRSTRDPAAQAAALGRFAEGLKEPIVRLRALHPPPLVAGTDSRRIRRLVRTRRLALSLRSAITARDPKAVARLLLRFRRVTSGGRGEGGFTGPAVRAYNERLLAISRAAAAVQRERSRVERSL